MPNPFLSEEWMADVRAIRERHAGDTPEITTVLKINQVINDVPFGDGTVETYLDTSSGQMVMEFGQLETPDVTITTDYATARTLFVDQDQAAAMQAFMAGKVVVQGDMMKLMAMQTAIPRNDVTEQVAEEIKAVTA
jgi:putative sterol carrier protein